MFLTNEQKKKYKIMSRKVCERYCTQKHSESSIIVSIKSSWDKELPHLFCDDKNNVKHILNLSFDDVEYEDDAYHSMQPWDGVNVANFINKYYNEAERIIVHCDGGISRSTGICAAIMRVKEGDDYPIFDNKNKHPNITCYLQTLKGFDYVLLR